MLNQAAPLLKFVYRMFDKAQIETFQNKITLEAQVINQHILKQTFYILLIPR